jgi:RHS repeat-associated protein
LRLGVAEDDAEKDRKEDADERRGIVGGICGQRQEAGIELYYYGARWYDTYLGRFISADTMIPSSNKNLDKL